MSEKLPLMEQLIAHEWNVDISVSYRFYIMDSTYQIILHPSSFLKKVLLILTFPVWYKKAKKTWMASAGWSMNNLGVKILGIKSIDEMKKSVAQNKRKIYTSLYDDFYQRAECTACHEMTHAYTSHYHLPFWLNEGIAQYTVDQYMNKPTISKETIFHLSSGNEDQDLNHLYREFLFGYWVVRYMEEKNKGVLRKILNSKDVNNRIIELLSLSDQNPREEVLRMIKEYFRKE
jgi:hypothetical protein